MREWERKSTRKRNKIKICRVNRETERLDKRKGGKEGEWVK